MNKNFSMNKLLVVGEANSGKTSFCERLKYGVFEFSAPSMGVKVYSLLNFKLWDCVGNPLFGGTRTGYYVDGECCLVFFDLSRNRTQAELLDVIIGYVNRVRNVCGEIPIVIVGSKVDLVEGELPHLDIIELPCCFISTREETNINHPLQMITNIL